MATLIKTTGEKIEVSPKNGKKFTLGEVRELIGASYIDIQKLPRHKKLFALDDEGKLLGKPENPEASKIWREEYPIEEFPHNNDGLIVGDVLLLDRMI